MSLVEKRGLARAALAGTLLCVAIGAHANPTAPAVVTGPNALPSGGIVAHGQATLNQQGSILSVTNTPGAIINWQSFSIGSASTTNFVQQSASSTVLNRVVGQNISNIAGKLLSNGHVFLTNPNGVLISSGAQINAASFTATTSAISDANFLAGNTQWSGEGSFLSGEGMLDIGGGSLSINPSGIISTANVNFTGTGTSGGNLTVATAGTVDVGGIISVTGGNLILDVPVRTVTPSTVLTPGSISLHGSGTILTASPGDALTVATGGTVSLGGSNLTSGGNVITTGSGLVTLAGQQGSTGTPVSTPAATPTAPVQVALPQTSIQAASTGSGAVTAGRNVIATANVAANPQPKPAVATLAAPRIGAVGATLNLQKREPMF